MAALSESTQPPFAPAAQTESPRWLLPWWSSLAAAAAAGLALWLCWDGVAQMWGAWITSPEYSHGLLIPPIAAFLVWQQRDRLERLSFGGGWWGVPVVLLGGFMLLLGQLGTVYTLVQYAYLVLLAGLALSFTGPRAFRLILVPLLVLGFMIPLPQFVLANLSTKLQLLSSQIGVSFIRVCGISVFNEGNVIDLGGYQLQVAEACDGLRYLFPLMTLGFLIAYFYKGAWWKRVLLFVTSMPLTVLMNSFRIGTIGVMVDRYGISMAEGFLHEFQGWAVFMASAALLILEMSLLNRIGNESGTWRQLFGIELPPARAQGVATRRRPVPRPFLAAFAVLIAFAIAAEALPRPRESVPPRASLTDFPLQFGPWHGRSGPLDGIYLDALHLDDYLLADYSDGAGSAVNLYIAWYDSQRKGEAVHSPRSCLPGGGWQLREFDQRTVRGVRVGGVPLRVNRTLIELAGQRELVYYWFQQRGRVVTNEFAVKWYIFWDALTRHRTDGALVRLMVALPPLADVDAADRRLTDMASRIAPTLARYVPD